MLEKKYLIDIVLAIELIRKFNEDTLDFEAYEKDLKTQSATERQLVIIGEALNKLKKIDTDIEIENGKQIIGFLNRLVHAYDTIDNSIVWAILNRHLDKLYDEIKAVLNNKFQTISNDHRRIKN